jgi:hypothetical protein
MEELQELIKSGTIDDTTMVRCGALWRAAVCLLQGRETGRRHWLLCRSGQRAWRSGRPSGSAGTALLWGAVPRAGAP